MSSWTNTEGIGVSPPAYLGHANSHDREVTTPLTADCATSATALFTGAAVYVSIVEHPARLQCSTEIAIA